MVVEREEDLQGRGLIASKTGLVSPFISSLEQLKTESFGVHVFQVPLNVAQRPPSYGT